MCFRSVSTCCRSECAERKVHYLATVVEVVN
jgi:hypothetical protein